MKKTILTFALVAVASATCHAASIKWAIGGAIDANAGIDTSVGSFVLAYIGTTSGVGVDAETFTTGVGSSYTIADTGTWSDFYVSARGTYANAKTLTTSNDTDGDTYQIFYMLNDSYFLVNDSMSTLSIVVNAVSGEASVTPYLNGTAASGSVAYATGGARTAIASVPEPSTAALALAGLALLLKRRKA